METGTRTGAGAQRLLTDGAGTPPTEAGAATAMAMVDETALYGFLEDPEAAVDPADVRLTRWRVRPVGFESDAGVAATLRGVILQIKPARAYYGASASAAAGDSTERQAPICRLVRPGVGLWTNPDGSTAERACAACPANKMGSGRDSAGNPTRGKACRERREILMLLDGETLPVVVAAPTTSIPVVSLFASQCVQAGRAPATYHVTLSTERQGQGDRQWGRLKILADGDLDTDALRSVRDRLARAITAVQRWQYGTEAEGEDSGDTLDLWYHADEGGATGSTLAATGTEGTHADPF
jgi:hypothetical protein